MTVPKPTGRVETRDGERVLVLTRHFTAPIDDVWAAVTESDRLSRWIGRWGATRHPAGCSSRWCSRKAIKATSWRSAAVNRRTRST